MPALSPYDTQWLTRASFAPAPARRRRVLALAAVLALVAGAGAGALYLDARDAGVERAAALHAQNAALAAELERTRVALGVERATRAELERQAAGLSERVSELTHQVEFLNSRGGAPKPAPQLAATE